MLTAAAEDGADVPQKAVNGFYSWIDCFDQVLLKGTVFAGGVNETGEIVGHPSLKEAYDMGASIK